MEQDVQAASLGGVGRIKQKLAQVSFFGFVQSFVI